MTEAKRIAPGGVNAVFDGVGKDTFVKSFDCMAPFGMLVNYGNASGHVPPLDILQLSLKGILSVCRVGVSHFLGDPARFRTTRRRAVRRRRARHPQDHAQSAPIRSRTPPQAHRDAEAAAHAGPVVLLP